MYAMCYAMQSEISSNCKVYVIKRAMWSINMDGSVTITLSVITFLKQQNREYDNLQYIIVVIMWHLNDAHLNSLN
jgi:hypothetical protein